MAQDKFGYIPPTIQRAMDLHMQRMPANLQKYQGGNTYIPQKAAQQMSSYMQKSMPAHMKQYIEPYMQQQVTAGLNSLDPGTTRTVHERAPAPDLMRRDNSGYTQQFTVDLAKEAKSGRGSLSFAPQYSNKSNGSPPAPPPAPLPNSNGSHGDNGNPYEFIMKSNTPKKGFGTGTSMVQRIIFVAVGAMLLLIVAIVFFSILNKGSNSSSAQLIDLAQQQTEIARVADIGVQKATSTSTKNFAHTTKLTMVSNQNQTVAILSQHHKKVSAKQLALKQNATTDQQLNDAAANNTFDATFTKLMTDELNAYRQSVLTAYKNSTNSDDKALLNDYFSGASILVGAKTST